MTISNNFETPRIFNEKYTFGIDISHHQGDINWNQVNKSHHPIRYIFIKASEGDYFADRRFEQNWEQTKLYGYIRGAYHFYSPNISGEKQFQHYSSIVNLEKGDFPPILDIEQRGDLDKQTFIKEILTWLRLAETKYGVQPIIYSGRNFYDNYLQGYLDYTLWIASYSPEYLLEHINWSFHQFSDKIRVKGINSDVDGNNFKGKLKDLKKLCVK